MELKTVKTFVATLDVYKLTTDAEIMNQFVSYYSYAFDTVPNCMGCPGDLEIAIHKLKWFLTKHPKESTTLKKAMALTKYTMKPGSRVYSFSLGIMITPFNCTDELAEMLIKENAETVKLFDLNDTGGTDQPLTGETVEQTSKKKGRKKKTR